MQLAPAPERWTSRPRRLARALAPLLLVVWGAGCISLQVFDPRTRPLVESVVYGESGPKILLIDVDGVISDSRGEPNLLGVRPVSMVARVREELDAAGRDPEVRALLLRINSPGGTATASDLVYREVMRFKRKSGVPVVAQLMGTATSGGYYVAMAADEVIAHPTTVTGSIGVIFLGLNVVGLMQKLGIENETLTAGDHKDAGLPLRRMRPDERAHIQAVLDYLHARFKTVVAEGRGLEAERVSELADGRIYGAGQALESGLVDRIGDLELASAVAQQRAGLAAARVVTYHRPREWRQNLYTRGATPTPRIELALFPKLPWWSDGPAFLYLWAPSLWAPSP